MLASTHGMDNTSLQTVYRLVIIAKLTYKSSRDILVTITKTITKMIASS